MRSVRLDLYVDEDEDWEDAFECLAKQNQDIESIDFNGCEGFSDACLRFLMNAEACPKLRYLCIHYSSCSREVVDEFKVVKPQVEILGWIDGWEVI